MSDAKTQRTANQIGKYRLTRMIGEGGMGQVFEAVHVELGRRAALKLLHAELAQDEELAARFFLEARAASSVAHAGLVHIYEYGHLDDGAAYIVMEYLQGESLRSRLLRSSGQLPVRVAIPLARQLAATLEAAHAQGVVHRDLKPENVMLVPDPEVTIGERTKIVDFGIAKLIGSGVKGRPITQSGAMLGTPAYMAPEQCGTTESIGPYTDVYALGAMLFEMLTGEPPFSGKDALQVVGQQLFSAPRGLRELIPSAEPELDSLLQQMLAKSTEARPTMRLVTAALARIEQGVRIRATSTEDATATLMQGETLVLRERKRKLPLASRTTLRSVKVNHVFWAVIGSVLFLALTLSLLLRPVRNPPIPVKAIRGQPAPLPNPAPPLVNASPPAERPPAPIAVSHEEPLPVPTKRTPKASSRGGSATPSAKRPKADPRDEQPIVVD